MVSFLCPKIIVMSISVKRIEYPDHSMTESSVRKGKTQIRAMRMVIQPCAQPQGCIPILIFPREEGVIMKS